MEDLYSTLLNATSGTTGNSAPAPGAFDPSKSYGTPPQLLNNLENQESSGGKNLVNHDTGAMGPYQFLPQTVAALRQQGVKFDPFDPQQSRAAADWYIQQLKQQNGGTYQGALKAYGGFVNADPTQYINHVMNGVPGFSNSAPVGTTPGQSSVGQQPSGYVGPMSDVFDTLHTATQSAAKSAPPVPQSPTAAPGALTSIAAGVGHGFGSMVLGAEELAGRGLNAVGAHSAGQWLVHDAQQDQQQIDAELAPYQQAHGVAAGAGDIAGGIAGVALTPEVKALQGAGFLANAAKGAAYGVVSRATSPDSAYLPQKAIDAVAGGLFGGVGAKLSQFVTPYLGKAVSSIQGRVGLVGSTAQASSAATGIVNDILQKAGIDPANVSGSAMVGPVSQIADALKSGGAPAPNAGATIARIGEAASLPVPVDLSAGQASRDPMQFAQERNWRGVEGVGETVQALEARQNSQLAGNLDALGAAGAPAPIDVGRSIMQAAVNHDSAWSNQIGQLYGAVKGTNGASAPVNTVAAMQPVDQALKDAFITSDNPNMPSMLPASVRAIFEGAKNGTLPLTAGDMMGLDRMLSREQTSSNNGNVQYAIGQIRQGLSNAQIDGSAGQQAVQAYNTAKAAAKARFDFMDASPWYRDAVNGVEPDNYFRKQVLQANSGPLNGMMDFLQKNAPDVAQDVQGTTADYLKSKAAPRSTADEVPVFNHATFDKLVTDPNNVQRLQAVFGSDGFDTIQSINNVARNIKTAPPGANVNYSGTAGALADMARSGSHGVVMHAMSTLGRAAGLGPMVDLGGAVARGIGNVVNRQKMAASVVTPQVARSAPSRAIGFGRQLSQAGGMRLSGLAGIPANVAPADEQPGR